MKREKFQIIANKRIAKDVYKLVLSGDTSEITAHGQFVNILIEGFYLRRPISICSYEDGELTLIYKVVGKGTKKLSYMTEKNELDLLLSLGNGFDISKSTEKTLLCGGGAGVPPLIGLAKAMLKSGRKPTAVLGFNTKEEVFGIEEFENLDIEVKLTTVDGSMGVKGFVTNILCSMDFDYLYCCGPEPMLKALHTLKTKEDFDGQFSFEARMACGFGACMGCSCETITGYKRICKEGPVLYKNEIKW